MSHQARKRFGQNFLRDQSIVEAILAQAQPAKGEHWLEIGPGQGALTAPLLDFGVKLDTIELDRDLVAYLRKKFSNTPALAIHAADALEFDFSSLVEGQEKLRIIGNLPYNISTPLLFRLMEFGDHIQDMVFMLQREVVARICAEPGSKTYGRLSVTVQYYCAAEWLFDVPPESFEPRPQVMSSIIRLCPHPRPPVVVQDLPGFQRLVAQAFSQRRKTIRNSLKNLVEPEQMLASGIDPNLRAECLSLAQFATLSRLAKSELFNKKEAGRSTDPAENSVQ